MTPRKVAAFAVGPIGGAFLGLITVPVMTWYFAQEDVGRIAMLKVMMHFSILFFTLGLDHTYVREFHEVENKPALLKHAFVPGLTFLSLILTGLLAMGPVLSEWLFGVSSFTLSALIGITIMAALLSRFMSLVLRMVERGLAFSLSQVLPRLALLAIIGGFVVLSVDKTLINLVWAHATAFTLVSILFIWNTREDWLGALTQRLDFARLTRMLKFGTPLILGGVAFWGLTAIDKVFLRVYASFDALGVYSVAVSLAGAATIFQSVFSTVWAPTVYKWASQGEGLENVHRVVRYVLAIVVVGFCLAGLLSWSVTFVLPKDYQAVQWIVVSCLGYPLLYTLSETTVVGVGVTKRSGFAMLAALIAFSVNLVGNWLLIPVYGAAGAAVSTCGSFWVFLLLRTEFSIYFWKPMPRGLLYVYTISAVMAASAFSLWGEIIGLYLYAFWILLLASAVWTFRRELGEATRFLCKS